MGEVIFNKTGYRRWLMSIVNCGAQYGKLCGYLDTEPYRWSIFTDENRAADAIDLRYAFADECGFSGNMLNVLNGTVSIFEVMVALAVRCEQDITGEPGEDRPHRIFWSMIQNLGLDKFTDEAFDQSKVSYIVDIWLERRFDSNGVGSPFPLKNPSKDQRTVELWNQMCEYVNENFSYI